MILNTGKRDIRGRLLPLVLSAGIILADQVSKILVMHKVPRGASVSVIGDFFRITHVQNPAIAFSLGHAIEAGTRRALFMLLPLLVIAVLFLYYLFTRDPLTRFQKWCFGALVGGGLGNYVDRIFRPAGVVDFLDFRFYGILGMERWPTFNLADATVVVSGILLFLSFLIPARKPSGDSP
ncbi:MAG TPA: signal peptidase II [Spirochaetia bacterium]|nr:signal peptidase II [Spirochaetia bacterium]